MSKTIMWRNKKDTDDNHVLVMVVIVVISVVALVLCFTVDIGVLHEVSQHPEYFYASETVGLSMYPQVYTGDMFIVQTVDHPEFNIKIGDIIVFDSGHNSAIGHRVLEVHTGYYVTRGDNNDRGERVYPSQVIGRVHKTIYRTNPIGQYMFSWVAG